MFYDFFNRLSLRLQITLACSLLLHLTLFYWFGTGKIKPTSQRLALHEIEYLEEERPQTEMEKFMQKLSPPPVPTRPSPAEEQAAAMAELEKTSFKQVVGLRAAPLRVDEVTDNDLTRLAQLPSLSALKSPPAPALTSLAPSTKSIALVRQAPSSWKGLASKVVPVDELPPTDFGLELNRKKIQQPELIIRQVKAERREQKDTASVSTPIQLKRDAFISGEVKERAILHRAYPKAPRWLEEKGIEAEVVIHFIVNPDGEVGDQIYIEKTSGYAELDQLAIEAVKKFLFAPLPLNVKQVEQKGTIIIRFTLRKPT